MSLTGYSKLQVRLHWIIALLVILQIALHDGIVEASHALTVEGNTPTGTTQLLAELHVILGLAIFILALIRIWTRINHGVPPPPPNEHPLLKLVARLTHIMLYVVVLLMPVSGSLAWFGQLQIAATLHGFAKPILILFVVLHIAGACFQHFVLKSNALRRMLRAESR